MPCSKTFSLTVADAADCQVEADAWTTTLEIDAGFVLTIHPITAYTGPPFTLYVENLAFPEVSQCVAIATGHNTDIVIGDWFSDPVALTAYCELCNDIILPAWNTFTQPSGIGGSASVSLNGGSGTWSIQNGTSAHAPSGGNVGMVGSLNVINTNSGPCPCPTPGVLRFTFNYIYAVTETVPTFGAFIIKFPYDGVEVFRIDSTGPQSGSGTFAYDRVLVAGNNPISFSIQVTGYGGAPSVGASASGIVTVQHIV